MNENKILKNKFIINEEDENDDQTYENKEYINEIEYEILNDEYFDETLIIIQKELLNYVNHTSQPLCEYLRTRNIENFLSKIF
jgi:uncharacterized membrane-anchored protein